MSGESCPHNLRHLHTIKKILIILKAPVLDHFGLQCLFIRIGSYARFLMLHLCHKRVKGLYLVFVLGLFLWSLNDHCQQEDVEKMQIIPRKIQPKSEYKPNMKYKIVNQPYYIYGYTLKIKYGFLVQHLGSYNT